MGWSYSKTLTNNTRLNASEVMVSLNEAKIGLETIDDTQVNFLSETSAFSMSAEGGHTHNGTDAAELAPPTTALRGGLKAYSEVFVIDDNSYESTTPAAHDFNAASNINTIVAAVVMWRNVNSAPNYAPEGAGVAWTTLNMASDRGGANPYDMYYWVIDNQPAKDSLWCWAALDPAFSPLGFTEFKAWILGF